MALSGIEPEPPSDGADANPSPFVVSPEVEFAQADRALAALFAVSARLAPCLDRSVLAGLIGVVATAEGDLRRHPDGEVALGRSTAIDLAADLLECADAVGREGHDVEAFALEGIEARLVEALVDAGPHTRR